MQHGCPYCITSFALEVYVFLFSIVDSGKVVSVDVLFNKIEETLVLDFLTTEFDIGRLFVKLLLQ